jgi:hypothetical protein
VWPRGGPCRRNSEPSRRSWTRCSSARTRSWWRQLRQRELHERGHLPRRPPAVGVGSARRTSGPCYSNLHYGTMLAWTLGLPFFGPGSHTSITKTREHLNESTISRKKRMDQKRTLGFGRYIWALYIWECEHGFFMYLSCS